MFRSLPFVAVLIALCTVFVSVQADALMDELVRKYTDNTKRSLPQTGSCTARNLVVRKEWLVDLFSLVVNRLQRDMKLMAFCRGNLSRTQRLDYIRAVKCLASRPSKFDRTKAPGVRSRYDDFEAAHIIQTPFTHGTGSFFTWHRHLLYLYETALREECGYNGFQPYWDWAKYADRPIKANPLYDGSDTSMSGNGRYIPNRSGTYQPLPIPIENPPALYCPPGTGGGPVFEGPFVNWELHLGPGVPLNNTVNGYPVNPNPRPDGLGYNPRRLLRDFNNTLLQDYNTYPAITSMLTNMTGKLALSFLVLQCF
jgi:tyrosinase